MLPFLIILFACLAIMGSYMKSGPQKCLQHFPRFESCSQRLVLEEIRNILRVNRPIKTQPSQKGRIMLQPITCGKTTAACNPQLKPNVNKTACLKANKS